MEVPSKNQSAPNKVVWPTVLYAVLWFLLLAGLGGAAIWFEIIKGPVPSLERIDQVAKSNTAIEKLCADVPVDNRNNCQEKIKKEIPTIALDIAEQSRQGLRSRIWLILLSLVIGVPLLLVAVRTFKTTSEENRPLWVIISCVVVLLFVLIVVSISVWNRPDAYVAYVPVPILEWGFAGGMLAAIHGLASGRYSAAGRLDPWVIARPAIGLFMGGVVYFIVLAGGILTNARLTANGQLQNNLWLNAVAFIAAYNDKFTEAVIGKVTSAFVKPEAETK